MSKKQEFIDYVKQLIDETQLVMSSGAAEYWAAFCSVTEKEKPTFTDNGKLVMKFLQEHQDTPNWKSRDIAEELFIGSRTVSGAMRKLVTDNFVEKIGEEPALYTLTEKGKNINIDEEN